MRFETLQLYKNDNLLHSVNTQEESENLAPTPWNLEKLLLAANSGCNPKILPISSVDGWHTLFGKL